jgi:hypothetical protein
MMGLAQTRGLIALLGDVYIPSWPVCAAVLSTCEGFHCAMDP